MIKVPACNSAVVKTDSKGRKYRWHQGHECGEILPSRYYIDTGVQFIETDRGLVEANRYYETAKLMASI